MTLSKRQKAVEIMQHLVTHDGNDGHGYTWGNRWGDGTKENIILSDTSIVSIANGDRDCSSGVISAWQDAGVNCGGATYTGNMISCMVSSGNFVKKPLSFIADPGDLYLNAQNHVAMCLTQQPDLLMEFSINEFGEVYGGKQGDQTNRESAINNYYNYPWDCILHYVGDNDQDSKPSDSTPSYSQEIRYRVQINGNQWLDEMIDYRDSSGSSDDYAGIIGNPITGLAINMSGWYQVCTEKNGWLEPVGGYNISDHEYGYAGDGSPILAVRCYYETQDPYSTGWLGIEYQCSSLNSDYYPSLIDLKSLDGDNYAGDMKKIDRFRARLMAL